MSATAEIEAKLLVPKLSELERLSGLRRLGAYRVAGARRAHLHTQYLDTADFALLRAGVALRVRRDGRRFEATAKWMGGVRGAVHARPELTVALAAKPGSRFQLPAGPLHDALCAIVAGRALAPVLITDIDRRSADLLPAGAARADRNVFAELAIDRVRVRSPRARGRVAAEYGELEVELRRGRRAALAELARQLVREFRLQPARDTKFSRGLSLLYGSEVLGARRFELPTAEDSMAEAARKVLGLQLAAVRAHDPGTRRGEEPEALHQMRVAVRRSRAALRALGDGIPARVRAEFARELRWLSEVLGAVRDLDVQLQRHARRARGRGAAQRRALEGLCTHLRAERERCRTQLLRALDSRRYFALLVGLEHFAFGRSRPATGVRARAPLWQAGSEALERAMAVVHRRGGKLARRRRPPEAEALHALRIRTKRARYLLEFMGELTGKPGRRVHERLVRLQDRLGEHQDAVVCAHSITGYLERTRAKVEPQAIAALQALITREERRAERARAGFHEAWREFAGARAKKDVRKVLDRLALAAASPARPKRRAKKA